MTRVIGFRDGVIPANRKIKEQKLPKTLIRQGRGEERNFKGDTGAGMTQNTDKRDCMVSAFTIGSNNLTK